MSIPQNHNVARFDRRTYPVTLLTLLLAAASSTVVADVPNVCQEKFSSNGAFPGLESCSKLASTSDSDLSNFFCSSMVDEYCSLEEEGEDPSEDDQEAAANAGDPSGCNGGDTAEGNPINVGTGNKYQREEDIRDWSPFADAMVRHYNSQVTGPDGSHWRHTWERRIAVDGFEYRDDSGDWLTQEDTLALVRADGRVLTFYRLGEHELAATSDESPADIPAVGTNQFPLEWTGSEWQYRNEAGELEYYNAEGQLLRITNRGGFTQTIERDGEGRVSRVVDPFNRALKFAYSSEGRLISVTDPAGSSVNYGYDSTGRLITVTDRNNATRTYHYGENGAPDGYLTGITDENGNRYARWAYDDQGRAILSEHAGGAERVEIDYRDDGTVHVVDANGGERTYTMETIRARKVASSIDGDVCGGCGSSRERDYDHRGLVTRKTDRNGHITTMSYNQAGLEVSRTEAVGTPAERKVTLEWDVDLRLPLTVAEPDRRTDWRYDAQGRVTSVTVTDTATGESRTTTYQYHPTENDIPGQLAAIDGPRMDVSDITRFAYDGQGNRIQQDNALGQTTTISGYDTYGRPTEVIGPNGLVTTLKYDSEGRLTQYQQGGGSTNLAYDDAGNLERIISPDSSELHYTYDDAHRLTAITDGNSNRIEYTLDAAGNRIEQRVLVSSGDIARKHRQAFDHLGRLIRSISAQGQITHYQHDHNDNLVRMTDANGQETRRAYDALDRLSQITDPLGGQVTFTYDASDNLTSVTDQRGLKTEYEYNFAGEMIARHSPDTGTTTFERDNAGNVIRKTDARGVVTEYSYDALNRLTEVRYPDAPEENIVYSYDDTANDNKGIGRLAGISDQSGTLAYRYDALGNVTEVNRTIEGQSYTTAYRYDLASNLTGITYPSGRIVTYTRNAVGEVSAITTQEDAAAPEQVVVQDVTYLPFGPMKQLTYGNGLVRDVSYNHDYQITGINSGALQRTYDYDLVDNIQSITDLLDPAQTQTFQYDALSRLTQATGAYGQVNYRYDGVGNRLSRERAQDNRVVAEEYTYASTSNQLKSVVTDDDGALSERQLSYSPVGNIDQDQQPDHQRSLIYNQQNRLEEIQQNGEVLALYIHNALGQRVIKVATDPEQNLHFHYDQAGRLIAETGPDGSVHRELIYLNGVPVAVLTETVEASLEPVGLEAEDATWSNAEVDSAHEGFSGSGFVDYLGEGYIEWTIEVPKAGIYALDVRYALASGSRPLEVQVDGATVQTLAFDATGSWTTWSDQPGELSLSEGTHVIRLQTTGSSGANIDSLRLSANGES